MARLNMVCVATFLCYSALILQSVVAHSLEKRSPQRVPDTLPGANGGGIQPISKPGANGGGVQPISKPGANGGGIRPTDQTKPDRNGGGGFNGGGIRPQVDLPRPGANGGGIAPTTLQAVTLPAKVSGVPGANGGGRPPVRAERSPQQLPAQLPGANGAGVRTTTLPSKRPGQNGGGVRPLSEKQTKPFIQQQTADPHKPAVLPARIQRSPQYPGANGGGRPPVGGHGNHAGHYTHGHQQHRPAYNPRH